jgi:hypothetical protein
MMLANLVNCSLINYVEQLNRLTEHDLEQSVDSFDCFVYTLASIDINVYNTLLNSSLKNIELNPYREYRNESIESIQIVCYRIRTESSHATCLY